MSTPTSGSDTSGSEPNDPQGGAAAGRPDWDAPQPPPGYDPQPDAAGHLQGSDRPGPDQPAHGQPAEPGYDQPGQPGYDQPGQPGYDQPGQPGYGQQPYGQQPSGQPGYGEQAYAPAPSYTGSPAGYGSPADRRPGTVTAAGVTGIVWGALGVLFGLLALTLAFAFGALLGLLAIVDILLAAVLLWAGIQVMQSKSPRLLLLICYIAIGINLITMVIGIIQGASFFSYLLGFVVPGVVVALLLNQQSKQYYAARGISY